MGFFTLLSLLSLSPPLLASAQSQSQDKSQTKHLTATAIVNTPDNTSSALECWQLTSGFAPPSSYDGSNDDGLNMLLADATNVTYVTRPGGEEYGLHKAPYAQIVVYLSGTINITVPTKDPWLIKGGQNGLFFAMDTEGEGHYASYPGNENTVGLMIPLKDGKAPEHVVLDDKPCEGSSQVV